MSEQPAGVTPGTDRTVQFFVNGGEFRLRRPSRADDAEILRRYTAKIMRACPPMAGIDAQEVAKETLNNLDGGSLLSESRLEVLLTPRVGAASFGEHAPAHWYRALSGPDGQVIERVIAFDDVELQEFDEVARYVDQALAPKKKPEPPASTGSAPGQTSG